MYPFRQQRRDTFGFREFAWRFTNVAARALMGLGRRPDYHTIVRYVTMIEPLLTDYFHLWLDKEAPEDWKQGVQRIEGNLNEKTLPMALRGRDFHAIALTQYAKEHNLSNPVADGLPSAFEYDKTYFDKLTASLLPLLEKLTSGRIGALLSPYYIDGADCRPALQTRRYPGGYPRSMVTPASRRPSTPTNSSRCSTRPVARDSRSPPTRRTPAISRPVSGIAPRQNEITACTLTDQLPKARVYTKLAAS
ncbi:MAG: hypothetical protein L3J84_08070 [Gammaproteobacteria bacterium]|nr:hypothetical protein [Gammaproteobacteria bacterium]